MYVHEGLEGLEALPSWLTNLGATLLSATHVSIPTPTGIPIVVNLGDAAQLEALKRSLLGTRIQVGATRPSPLDQARTAVEKDLPGGWWTIGLGAAALAGGFLWVVTRRH
jgi:hypothetical protein